jgi:Major Facilitator Superfamily
VLSAIQDWRAEFGGVPVMVAALARPDFDSCNLSNCITVRSGRDAVLAPLIEEAERRFGARFSTVLRPDRPEPGHRPDKPSRHPSPTNSGTAGRPKAGRTPATWASRTNAATCASLAGLRPEPFYLGIAFAGLGLVLSTLFVGETRGYARLEAANAPAEEDEHLSTRDVFVLTSFRERALSAASQAGLVNNLNDGLAWGILPLFFAGLGLSVSRIGILAALYLAVWGLGQLATGALSDRCGRKWLIATGMWVQAVAIALFVTVHGFTPWAGAAVLLGAGTAMVYPTLLATIGDVAHPRGRASAAGV